jgi:hypothetical protein
MKHATFAIAAVAVVCIAAAPPVKIALLILTSILIVIYFLTAEPHPYDKNPRFTKGCLYVVMVVTLVAIWAAVLAH